MDTIFYQNLFNNLPDNIEPMKLPVSKKIVSLSASPTVELANYAKQLEREGRQIIHFEIGEPDFITPKYIIDAAVSAMKHGKTHYTSSLGLYELREKIASLQRIKTTPENILVTPGAKFALFSVIMALIEKNDEVIIHDPAWPTYEAMVSISGGLCSFFSFNTIEELENKVSEKTKLIIINSPCNPTGELFRFYKEISELSDFYDFYIIADEIYSFLTYDEEFKSMREYKNLCDWCIVIDGFSKSYAMTGWRIGYIIGPEEIISACNKIQQTAVTCASSISQYAALAALEDSTEIKNMRKQFKKRRALIMKRLKELNLSFPYPEGAFYVFPDFSEYISDSRKLSKILLEHGVAATPGIAFGKNGEGHIRLSYALSERDIDRGMDIIEKLLRKGIEK